MESYSFRLTLCLLVLGISSVYCWRDLQHHDGHDGLRLQCGSFRVVTRNDIFGINDEQSAKGAKRFQHQSRRYRRSASPSPVELDTSAESGEMQISSRHSGRARSPQTGARHIRPGFSHSLRSVPFSRGVFPLKKRTVPVALGRFPPGFTKQFGNRYGSGPQNIPSLPQMLAPTMDNQGGDSSESRRSDIVKEIKRVGGIRRTPNFLRAKHEPSNVTEHRHSIRPQPGKKIPLFIEHMLDSHQKTDPRLFPPPNPEVVKFREDHSNNNLTPRDILQSLGADKLEQLRNFLNSASGPYGAGSKEISHSQMLKTFSDQRGDDKGAGPRFRVKRDLRSPLDTSGSQVNIPQEINYRTQITPVKCSWMFKRGPGCEKLVLKLQYIIDGAKDCSQEYLQIIAGNRTLKHCEQNTRPVTLSSEDRIYVEHVWSTGTSPEGQTKFKGAILCE